VARWWFGGILVVVRGGLMVNRGWLDGGSVVV
jgi:hypothetical protein